MPTRERSSFLFDLVAWKSRALPLTGSKRDESYCLAEGAEPMIVGVGNDGLPCEMRKKRIDYKKITIRDVAQFGSAPVLGTGGRRFKSCHPYPNSFFSLILGEEERRVVKEIDSRLNVLSSVGRAQVSKTCCRRFESYRACHTKKQRSTKRCRSIKRKRRKDRFSTNFC